MGDERYLDISREKRFELEKHEKLSRQNEADVVLAKKTIETSVVTDKIDIDCWKK